MAMKVQGGRMVPANPNQKPALDKAYRAVEQARNQLAAITLSTAMDAGIRGEEERLLMEAKDAIGKLSQRLRMRSSA